MAEILPIEEIISIALTWQADQQKRGQAATAPLALSHAFSEYGRAEIQVLRKRYQTNGSAVAEHINDFHSRLDPESGTKFIRSWACIFDGQLAPCIMQTPFNDWSTSTFLGAFNDEISGLGFPVVRFGTLLDRVTESDKTRFEDGAVTTVISDILRREKTVGWFFEDLDNLYKIKPVELVLSGYSLPIRRAVIEIGQIYNQGLNQMKAEVS